MVSFVDVRDPVTQSGTAFARHQTFHLRDGWLYKALAAVQADAGALTGKEAHHDLGVGKNMLQAISYWIQATNLVKRESKRYSAKSPLSLTPLAELIVRHDPYLEDPGTLWALQIELASNSSTATFWYWAFNMFPQREFTEDRLAQSIKQYLDEQGISKVAESSLHKDGRCFLRTYVPSRDRGKNRPIDDSLDCPLSVLGLVRETPLGGRYKFQIGHHNSLPTDLFAYALYRFKEHTSPDDVVVSLEDVRWAPLSPGRLLCLDMRAILDYLEELEFKTSHVRVIRTEGLNMVSLSSSVASTDLLEEYYGS